MTDTPCPECKGVLRRTTAHILLGPFDLPVYACCDCGAVYTEVDLWQPLGAAALNVLKELKSDED